MDVASRLARRLLESGVSLDRGSLTRAGVDLLDDEGPLAERAEVVRAVDQLVGLGPLEDLLRDPEVSDVLVNGAGDVWVERSGVLERSALRMSGDAVRSAVERVIAPLGLRLDRSSPSVDARLPDGSRLHAAIPPVSVDGAVLAVRRFTEAVPDLAAMVGAEGILEEGAHLLRSLVADRANLVVSGSTGSGKTTLLNVLMKEIPAGERVVTVEDAAELQRSGHMVRLEARPPNSEGYGEITLRSLLRQALRLRPDRIIVGEVRGAEAIDMVRAMSTGHPGSMSTVHAGSAAEALWRLESLAVGSGEARNGTAVRLRLLEAVDFVVQMARVGTTRRVHGIYTVGEGGLDERYRCP